MSDSFSSTFRTIWKGGYFEGVPTDPMSGSSYGIFGYHSSLYLTYLCCIKPYIGPETTVLEIGCGRGAWTKAIADLQPKQVFALDVVEPEYAGFWHYVGRRSNVSHVVVTDFSLSAIPDLSLDYFFSYGCFCHLKPDMCIAYINSLAAKMKPGAHGFLMIADFDKFNACMAAVQTRSVGPSLVGKRFALIRAAFGISVSLFRDKFAEPLDDKPPEGALGNKLPVAREKEFAAGSAAWFHLGVDRACESLRNAGFRIIESDVQVNHRDPVIHFVKN